MYEINPILQTFREKLGVGTSASSVQVGGQQSAVSSRRSAVGSRRSTVGSLQSPVSSRRSAVTQGLWTEDYRLKTVVN